MREALVESSDRPLLQARVVVRPLQLQVLPSAAHSITTPAAVAVSRHLFQSRLPLAAAAASRLCDIKFVK